MTSNTRKVRKGPSASATKHAVGTIKRGNDGNRWVNVSTKSGMRRWQRFALRDSRATRKRGVARPGANQSLETLWQQLASGKVLIFVRRDGSFVKKLRKFKTASARIKEYKANMLKAQSDPNVVAVLTSAQSYDSWDNLYRIAKNASPNAVIRNYRKFFTESGDGNKLWYAGKA